jgi:hypothetical protein
MSPAPGSDFEALHESVTARLEAALAMGARAEALQGAVSQLVGQGRSPDDRVALTLDGRGFVTAASFLSIPPGTEPEVLSGWFLAALAAARQDLAEQNQALFAQAGLVPAAEPDEDYFNQADAVLDQLLGQLGLGEE